MTYADFKETYNWITKEAPDTMSIYSDHMMEVIGKVQIVNYEKVGSKWKEVSRQTDDMTRTSYMNIVDAVPFFRNLGGSEDITKRYTRYGYIPTEIASISPDKRNKTVRKMIFHI